MTIGLTPALVVSIKELVAFATATLLVGAAIESVVKEAANIINPGLLKSKGFIRLTHLFNGGTIKI